ncbi:hypothetical protein FOPG_19423 [Fusarium oxysporum f. sp. conglutinans race 2 54008]|uniref:Uncharacterized protein n=1 Tax=Fusarium oxysporum f. sp. conglutinans race 2 54008 TaxID=1089457 RepID=X0GWQ2_FUSOX|nr:hypothetical protein FOPG_19423 [Fusarium oxysporum f. sp. conglutinans race 2 54008]
MGGSPNQLSMPSKDRRVYSPRVSRSPKRSSGHLLSHFRTIGGARKGGPKADS